MVNCAPSIAYTRECGFNADTKPKLRIPTREQVAEVLEQKLQEMERAGRGPDVITLPAMENPRCTLISQAS